VANNFFTGEMVEEIGSLTRLDYLFLSGNRDLTTGLIPASFANLTGLEELGLKSTARTGLIPSFIGDMVGLKMLDLDDNRLSAKIPTELGQLAELEFLLLNRNLLSGPIPTELGGMTSLRVAFFDRNSLTGTLEMLCDLATFNEQANDTDGNELLSADCLAPNSEVFCSCCTTCCNDANDSCNNEFEVANLDPIWEFR